MHSQHIEQAYTQSYNYSCNEKSDYPASLLFYGKDKLYMKICTLALSFCHRGGYKTNTLNPAVYEGGELL